MPISIFKPKLQSGALPDQRPRAERNKDFRFEELVTSINPVNWQIKNQSQFRKFPIFDQNGSGSCVAQTAAKLLGINYWLKNNDYVHFSATHVYQRRSNRPSAGMFGVEAMEILTKGVTLEELARSQNLSDEKMDGMIIEPYKEEVGKIFKVSNYLTVQMTDMETVASIIQTTGKGVMVWFYFMYDEWTNTPEIKDPNLHILGSKTVRHSVTAVDYAIYNGKKGLVIDDSWGAQYGWNGQRFISEEFFKARNFFTSYPMNFSFDSQESEKPRYSFHNNLEFSPIVTYGNADVIALQNCLKWLGFFPKNVESTGYFGALTKKAVIEYQKSKGLNAEGFVYELTRAELNREFA